MNELRGPILQTVSRPLQFLWAPFELGILNIVFATIFMLLSLTILNLTPFLSLVPLVVGHVALIIIGSRNPHAWSTVQSIGKYRTKTSNLAGVSHGVKYVP